ncbi:hypothetical protein J2D73_13305 [Acetobacter sacchari]|uniref:Uncharacterized protein n=1 Tax=Acetobacter sacchari TaxID=2661687 RepID=A0ABS3LXW9_9PROT|nr:hypothetical protein [Acetobacter sacchari]MBO1360764.1 hypothetical protein [Acetobacter sacchari]
MSSTEFSRPRILGSSLKNKTNIFIPSRNIILKTLQKIIRKQPSSKFNFLYYAKIRKLSVDPRAKIGTRHQKQGRDENPIHISFQKPEIAINRTIKPSTLYLLTKNNFEKKLNLKTSFRIKLRTKRLNRRTTTWKNPEIIKNSKSII